mgnify:FL=1
MRSLTAKFMVGITGLVLAVLFIALSLDFAYQQRQADVDLLAKASLVAKQQQATRSFISRSSGDEFVHGGEARPLEPAEVGEGVSDLFADLSKSQVKQTNLVPRIAENAPDDFERAALEYFMASAENNEVWQRVTLEDGTPAFRYIMALRAEESCLRCHGEPKGELDPTGHPKEGLKLGDVAGAISVTLPMRETLASARAESVRLAAIVVFLALLCVGLIWLILWRQVALPLSELADVATTLGMGNFLISKERLRSLRANHETAVVADAFEQMSDRLRELYTGLEHKVAERTKELEEANRELERISRYKSEFLTMISHELRTPLTSIIAFTELLLADRRLEPEQRESLSEVLESSQKLLNMITNLLDFSRIEAGKVKLFREMLDLRDSVRDVVRTVQPLAERKQITLALHCPSDLPLVYADPLRISQVVLNLLSNAVKFTPEGGSIDVECGVDGDQVRLTVRDTGPGVPREEQEVIFQAFRQGGERRPEGWGLGLALSASLVKAHGGRIWVDSEPGAGAAFTFTLPMWSEQGSGGNDEEANPGS